METSTSTIDYEKIDFYKILNNYRIKNIVGFRSYLIYLWKDLTLRSENGNKGINKIIFAKGYGFCNEKSENPEKNTIFNVLYR